MAADGAKGVFANEASDPFNGVTIKLNAEELKMGPAAFQEKLATALANYRKTNKRGIWLSLSEENAELIPVAVKNGFHYHHAKSGEATGKGVGELMLAQWLPKDEESTLPLYPHHQIGVGGMVLNHKGQVLNIQEKMGVTVTKRGTIWKLPGGLVDPKEDIQAGAIREVLEETGIKTVFKRIVGWRETHQGPFGSTDCYMVCALQLDPEVYKEGEIPTPVPQEKEIANCEWRDLEKFLGPVTDYSRGGFGDMMRMAAESCMDLLRDGKGTGLGAVLKRSFGNTYESIYFSGLGEKKVDPEDGQALTWDQLGAKYKGKYSTDELTAYWEKDMAKAPTASKL